MTYATSPNNTVRSALALHIFRNPAMPVLDVLDKFSSLSVMAILAAKHVFFTGDAGDAQELSCTDDAYRAGYKLYRNESVSAGAPWAKGWERET